MDTADAWKRYYAAERARIGERALVDMLDEAPSLALHPGGATVIPHTRLEITGRQVAAAANAVVDGGAERVLAVGVLHGGRRADAAAVARARAGDPAARADLRGVHDEEGLAAEEFSLDAFVELVGLAAARAGRTVDVVRRYPFLVGDDPASLPGLDELARLVDGGAVLVVTTDPVHHGHAYGTALGDCLDPAAPGTLDAVRAAIEEQLAALADHRYVEFQELTARHQSDFRDTGPVMASLVGAGFRSHVHDLALVDYAAVLDAASPSWVAGALVDVTR